MRTATQQGNPLSAWTTFLRRVRNTTRTIFARGDIFMLFIAVLLMLVPVLALAASLSFIKDFSPQTEQSVYPWQPNLNTLIPIGILSVIFGFLLAKSYYGELLSLVLNGIYGVGIVGAVQVLAAPGPLLSRVVTVSSRFMSSTNAAINGHGIDPFLLLFFFSILIWFLGHNTAWHIFRVDRAWRAVLPPGIVLVLNSFYNTQQTISLDPYLIIYTFLALLIVIHSHIEAREYDWFINRIAYQGNLRNWFFRAGAIIGVVALILAWLMPTGSAADNAKRFQDFLNGDVGARVNQLLNRLFGSLEGQGVTTADYFGKDTLTLGGPIQLGDQVVMVVKAPPDYRYYWKSRTFDTYADNSWTATRGLELTQPNGDLAIRYPPTDPTARQDVKQDFSMVISSSRLVYAAPQPEQIGLPSAMEMDYIDKAAGTENPSVIRPLTPIKGGDTYSVVSSVTNATIPFLRAAKADYPDWVTAKDLQLPSTITQRTRVRAQQIVQDANAQTPYDKAKAIEQWLRKFVKYNAALPTPPTDTDLVDWVLFTQREGYCTYYASAMIVMLRSLGIPARMAAGFAQGTWDASSESYIVRERDAHTWVEVYFPGAGWVEFEPTASQQNIERPDPNVAQFTPTPTSTFTPSPSPSPMPSPTSTQKGQQPIPPTLTPQPPQPQATFTAPPQPTPVPTPTPPPPAPLQFLDIPPGVIGAFQFLALVASVVAVLSFILVGFLWWVEYRGLDRLSSVGRAYARLEIYARWLGIGFHRSNTPLERGRRISREVPPGNRPVMRITDLYIAERYAPPHDATFEEEKFAQDAWKQARSAFIGRKIRKWLRRE